MSELKIEFQDDDSRGIFLDFLKLARPDIESHLHAGFQRSLGRVADPSIVITEGDDPSVFVYTISADKGLVLVSDGLGGLTTKDFSELANEDLYSMMKDRSFTIYERVVGEADIGLMQSRSINELIDSFKTVL